MWKAGKEGEHGNPPERQESEEEGRRVWILPTDLLLLVFARLTAVDLIRAGAVCAAWRSAVKAKGRPPPRTILPWLMPPRGIETTPEPGFMDPNARKTYKIHLPDLHQTYLFGQSEVPLKQFMGRSDDGFLVYQDMLSRRLSMINPITGATVCFPPLPAPHLYIYRVLVLSTGTGYTVVIHHGCGLISAFADAGSLETWGSVLLILVGVNVQRIHVCGKKLCGLFFQLEGDDDDDLYRFFSCDLKHPIDLKVWAFKFGRRPCWSELTDSGDSFPVYERGKWVGNCPKHCCSTDPYPVVLPNGDLIVVCGVVAPSLHTAYSVHTIAVTVYRMPADLNGEAEIVTSIGNYALFFDDYGSIVLPTLKSPELKPSTFYFNDQCFLVRKIDGGWKPGKQLIMFDIKAQPFPIHVRNRDHSMHISWFVPAF